MIDTRHVRGRRRLRFADLNEVVREARHLAERPTAPMGNWTLGQVCRHLATAMELCIDGGVAFPVALKTRLAGAAGTEADTKNGPADRFPAAARGRRRARARADDERSRPGGTRAGDRALAIDQDAPGAPGAGADERRPVEPVPPSPRRIAPQLHPARRAGARAARAKRPRRGGNSVCLRWLLWALRRVQRGWAEAARPAVLGPIGPRLRFLPAFYITST